MVKMTIDDMEIEVDPGFTVLQACEQAGKEIPRFCYHEKLSIAGNCRMCLVHMERAPKLIASCAMPVADGMVIKTDTPEVIKSRKGVMEFLLINHPLDCPVCDQGGECDLQDQAMAFGVDRSRYSEVKRAVTNKNIGPLIRTVMTRCIHCTRCVRFSTEIAGVEEMGAVNRGVHTEIGTYIEKALRSELSGNMIDLCPVGALTSAPYAFMARPWELRKTESVDVFDAVGSNIRVDSRSGQVMRILPRINDAVNEEWISDKTRFACDGLKRQRLDKPYIRIDGHLKHATWDQAFNVIAEKLKTLKGTEIAAIAGDMVDCEAMMVLKTLLGELGSGHIDCRQDGAKLDPSYRAGYLFNTGIANIEHADACLLIGTNPRTEAAVLNARLRKRWLHGDFPVAVIGENVDLTYPVEHLGEGRKALQQIASGRSGFAKILKSAKRPMLILGQGALTGPDGAEVLALARKIAEKFDMINSSLGWNGFNVLHRAAARVGGLDLGFVPGKDGLDVSGILDSAGKGDVKAVYLLGADEIDMSKLGNAFVIYQGHHGDAGAHRADVILPGAAYTEKNATYVNTEGRVQLGRLAVYPPGDAREDWTIIRALADKLGVSVGMDSLRQVRATMVNTRGSFLDIDQAKPAEWPTEGNGFGTEGDVLDAPFPRGFENFYMTDPISRASETMAECMASLASPETGKTGTNG